MRPLDERLTEELPDEREVDDELPDERTVDDELLEELDTELPTEVDELL